jgi:hypothetical protein
MRLLYCLIQLFIAYPLGYHDRRRPVMVKARLDSRHPEPTVRSR